MTIAAGQPWGRPGALPIGSEVADSDARLADIIVSTRGSSEAPPSIGLTGGSLWRTVGGPGAIGRLYTGEAMHLPIDLVRRRPA